MVDGGGTHRSWWSWLNRSAGVVALPIAVLALLLAGWTALWPDRTVASDGPTVTVTPSKTGAPLTGTPPKTTEPRLTTGPEPSETAGTGSIDNSTLPGPSAQYRVGITARELTLNPGGLRHVDLDSATIGPQTGAELRYPSGGFGNSPGMQFQTSRVASTNNPGITPGECAERIQTAPIDPDISPAKDQVFCVVTDGIGATGDAVQAKIAIVVVRNVDRTGAITVSVTNWDVP